MKQILRIGALGIAGGVAFGCGSPMDRSPEQAMREQLIAEYKQRLAQTADGGIVVLSREPGDVERKLTPARQEELDRLSGATAYANDPLVLGRDLQGRELVDVVELSRADAVRRAVDNNLDVRVARLGPAIGEQDLLAAEAAFDATFFTTASWGKLDTPQPPGIIPGLSGDTQSETFQLTTGITQPLKSGGAITISDTITRDERTPSVIGVRAFYDNDVALSVSQPLLRGFGRDVNTAQISLADNAQQRDIEALRQNLLDTVQRTEAAYWDLAFARELLLIRTRLLERTVVDRDRLEQRAEFDAAPVQVTEANSFVELRRGEVIRARQAVRDASDTLKQLINSDTISVVGETLLVPTDRPGTETVDLSLLDAVTTAMRRRPELQVALLAISDAGVRQRVADNARLPVLDVGASVVYNGIDVDRADEAFSESLEGDYIDYLLSANFELPLGNRAAKAAATAAQLQRQQAVLAYQSQAQAVVLEVKRAMRNVQTAYELIGSTRAARLAAADNLRTLQAQEDEGAALTPDFINLKLQSQERLAIAETQEAQALLDYANALSAYDRATGSLLDRNQIVFEADRK